MKYHNQHPQTSPESLPLPEISADDMKRFVRSCKNGIYKELHQQKLLNDDQLNLLLKQPREVPQK